MLYSRKKTKMLDVIHVFCEPFEIFYTKIVAISNGDFLLDSQKVTSSVSSCGP